MVRGEITAKLGTASFVGNSVLRVIADAQAAMSHLVLRYIDWLSRQFLPDTAETEWLDRHGDIWLVNADGTTGRKSATYANGVANLIGVNGTAVPEATQFEFGEALFETTEGVVIGTIETAVHLRAITVGLIGNVPAGSALSPSLGISGLDNAIVIDMTGGTDAETDEELRARVLRRIRQPPMGGAAYDYEAWALAVPGVTRAWAASEMGIGTVTVRFMMDDLRADNDGFPLQQDVDEVEAYINSKRPVAVKDFFVVAPIKFEITCVIDELVPDNQSTRGEIEQSLREMLLQYAAPGQTIFAA